MTRTIFLSLSFVLGICLNFHAQNSYQDSLETKILLVNDSAKMVIYPLLIDSYLQSSYFEDADRNANKFLKLTEEQGEVRQRVEALKLSGVSKQELLSDHEQSLELLLQALKLSENNGFKSMEVEVLISIGDIFLDINNNYQTLDYLLKADSKAEKIKNSDLISKSKFKISETYLQLNEFSRAFEYISEGCSVLRSSSQKQDNLRCLSLKSKYFEMVGDYESAIEAIDLAINNTKEGTQDYALFNLKKGNVLKIQKQYSNSLQYFEAALTFYEKEQKVEYLSRCNLSYGDALMKLEQYDSAYEILSKGLRFAIEINSKELILDGYEKLYQYYLAIEDFDNAEEYKNLFIEISEFINTEKTEQKIGELQTQYEVGKKEQEIQVLERNKEIQQLTIEKQKNRQFILLMSLGLLLVLILAGSLLYRSKRRSNKMLKLANEQVEKQNEELKELNATKDKFFSIIGHDLKGPLNSLTSFSNLLVNHSGSLSPDEIKMLATDLDKSIKNLFSLLDNLLNWARSQSGRIELESKRLDLKELVDSNISLLQRIAENKSIEIVNKIDLAECFADENTINTVIRNLLSNALKFTEEKGKVYFTKSETDGMISIHISDNGVGMTKDQIDKLFQIGEKQSTLGTSKEKGTGLGLILCKEFVEMNGGTLSVKSIKDEGSTFSIKLKKAYTN
ncbi:MAG: HAMP domain-containing sensor histidine kinase [Bacteroidota bacterium]